MAHLFILLIATLTPAFEICVLGMKMGEKCLLTTSFEYGYGELGNYPLLPLLPLLHPSSSLYTFLSSLFLWKLMSLVGVPDRIPAAANLQYEIELFWFNEDSSVYSYILILISLLSSSLLAPLPPLPSPLRISPFSSPSLIFASRTWMMAQWREN